MPQFGALEGEKVKRRSFRGPAEGRRAPLPTGAGWRVGQIIPRAAKAGRRGSYSAMLAFSQRVRPGSFTRVVWVKPPILAPLRLMNSA